jgi:hypothetical protein
VGSACLEVVIFKILKCPSPTHPPTQSDKRDNSSHLIYDYSSDLYQVILWVTIFVNVNFSKYLRCKDILMVFASLLIVEVLIEHW